ncbi:hypothetical protein CB1_000371016 [Camelus ferus]|nr:hypothetical protein CB1_000371016 [Camelus ferus]
MDKSSLLCRRRGNVDIASYDRFRKEKSDWASFSSRNISSQCRQDLPEDGLSANRLGPSRKSCPVTQEQKQKQLRSSEDISAEESKA